MAVGFFHFRVIKDSDWINYYNGKYAGSNLFPTADVTAATSREELCQLVGLASDSKKAQPKELWRFRNAKVGDIVFANKAIDTCRGVGIIDGEYTYNPTKTIKHTRSVNWLTKKEYIFIKERYLEHFAAIGSVFEELFYNETFDTVAESRGRFILGEYMKKYPELATSLGAI
jgi:hypothetical protein